MCIFKIYQNILWNKSNYFYEVLLSKQQNTETKSRNSPQGSFYSIDVKNRASDGWLTIKIIVVVLNLTAPPVFQQQIGHEKNFRSIKRTIGGKGALTFWNQLQKIWNVSLLVASFGCFCTTRKPSSVRTWSDKFQPLQGLKKQQWPSGQSRVLIKVLEKLRKRIMRVKPNFKNNCVLRQDIASYHNKWIFIQ